jgi:hypothetical protein
LKSIWSLSVRRSYLGCSRRIGCLIAFSSAWSIFISKVRNIALPRRIQTYSQWSINPCKMHP